MTTSGGQDLSAFSMLDLFRQETEAQTAILNESLVALEQDPGNKERLAAMMRAAHSLKGAARIVNLDPAVKVAHALEDCFVAAQKGEIVIQPEAVDGLLSGVDMLTQIARVPEAEAAAWRTEASASTIKRARISCALLPLAFSSARAAARLPSTVKSPRFSRRWN